MGASRASAKLFEKFGLGKCANPCHMQHSLPTFSLFPSCCCLPHSLCFCPSNPPLQDGDRFWRMPEAYIRGNTIKYLRVPDEVLDKAKEADFKRDGERVLGALPLSSNACRRRRHFALPGTCCLCSCFVWC